MENTGISVELGLMNRRNSKGLIGRGICFIYLFISLYPIPRKELIKLAK